MAIPKKRREEFRARAEALRNRGSSQPSSGSSYSPHRRHVQNAIGEAAMHLYDNAFAASDRLHAFNEWNEPGAREKRLSAYDDRQKRISELDRVYGRYTPSLAFRTSGMKNPKEELLDLKQQQAAYRRGLTGFTSEVQDRYRQLMGGKNFMNYQRVPGGSDKLSRYLDADENTRNLARASYDYSMDKNQEWSKMGERGSWDFLRPNEQGIYYTLLQEQGEAAADKYLKDMETVLNRRQYEQEMLTQQEEFADKSFAGKVASSAVSVPANLVGGTAQFVEDTISGIKGKDINPYSRSGAGGRWAQQHRQLRAQDYDRYAGNKSFLGFTGGDVYQAAMSMADSRLGSLMGGPSIAPKAYGAIMGMGAASSEAKRLYEMGATKEQIQAGSAAAGAAEYLTEEFSLDKLLSMKDPKSKFTIIRNMLLQGGIEGSEEVASEIANVFTNALIMHDKSDWHKLVEENGGNVWRALLDEAYNVWKAFGGGFMAGAPGGGVQSTVQYVERRNAYRPSVPELIQEGLDSPEGSKSHTLALQYQEKVGRGKKLSGTEINRLIDANEEQFAAEDQEEAEQQEKSPIEEAAENIVAQEEAEAQREAEEAAAEKARREELAYQQVLGYGRSGVPQSYAEEEDIKEYLADERRAQAYQEGVAQGKEATGKAIASLPKANGKTGRRIGTVKAEGVNGEDLRKTFNDTQNKAYKILANAAEATGFDIVLYKSEADEKGNFPEKQGRFDPNTNTFYVDINAGLTSVKDVNDLAKYAMVRTFSHELTHGTEKWNPGEYDTFRKLVFDTMTQRGENVNDLIELQQAQNKGMTYDQASREVVAEAMTDILEDSKFIQNLAEEHQNIFQRLYNSLKEFISNIKEYFSSLGQNRSREARALKEEIGDTVRYLDNIVKGFDKLATGAVENYQAAYAVDETVETATEDVETATEDVETATEDVETATEDVEKAINKPKKAVEKPVETVEKQEEQEPESTVKEEPKPVSKIEPKTEPVTVTSENGFSIRPGTKEGYVEVDFGGRPSAEILDLVKDKKFRWNGRKKVWWGKADAESLMKELDNAFAAGKESLQVEEPETISETETVETPATPEESQAVQEEPAPEVTENSQAAEVTPAEDVGEPIQRAKQKLVNSVKMPIKGTNMEALLRGIETGELSMQSVTLPGKVPGFTSEQRLQLARELIDGVYTDNKVIKVSVENDGSFEVNNTPDNVAKVLNTLKVKVNQEDLIDKKTLNMLMKHNPMGQTQAGEDIIGHIIDDGIHYISNGGVAIPVSEEVFDSIEHDYSIRLYPQNEILHKQFDSINNKLGTAPLEAEYIGSGKDKGRTLYVFDTDDGKIYAWKDQIDYFDGDAFYYKKIGSSAMIRAENDSGETAGFVGAVTPRNGKMNIGPLKPSKLKSFSGKKKPAVKSVKEDITNEESTNGLNEEPVQQSAGSGETASQLLEGVQSEPVSAGNEGRGSVQPSDVEGTGDAGRNGPSDAAGPEPVRSTGDRVGGRVQQQPVEEKPGESNPEQLHEEVKQEVEKRSKVQPKGTNLVIKDSLNLPTGEKARIRANLDAIKVVKNLIEQDRYATAEEQEILSKYVGWGGLPNAFGKSFVNQSTHRVDYQAVEGLEEEFNELRDILTKEEYESARSSTKNAHYTSIEVIKAMYDGLKHLGFTGGRMLEPSSGTGNFVGAMPAEMSSNVKSWTMVELDSITGQIAKYLYPQADVRVQGFEDANIPDGYMDVAIGNVPFGDYGVVDKRYPKNLTGSIHNYFFAKSLDKVRPGGVVMFITSSFTMNGRDSAVRKYIMQKADLLGAIRLPNTAFAGNAGTSVVTDILVLKKRADKTYYSGEAFENSEWKSISGYQGGYVNEYFESHPEMVLGIPSVKRGMYSAETLTYDPYTDRGTLGDQIREAMSKINGKMDYATQPTPEQANVAQAKKRRKSRRLQVQGNSIKAIDENGNLSDIKVDEETAKRISGMVGIRDAHAELCDALQQGKDAKTIKGLRSKLNKAYDAYVAKNGFLNDSKNKKAINQFADRYSILSLEKYDPETKKAEKSDIFKKDTVSANVTVTSAENVEEGLTISMNTTGHVDVDLIAKLTGQNPDSVKRQLIDQRIAFKDKDGVLIPAVQYLSGNVRAKLREMEGLVGIDKDYQNNVDALREVVPPTVPYTDIFVNPGANWVPASVYEDFISHILDRMNHQSYRTGKRDFTVEFTPATNTYKVSINDTYAKGSAQNTQIWGVKGKTFKEIYENLLNGKKTNVYMDGPDGTRVLDKVATETVAEKAEQISEEFRKWLWEDESRQKDLQEAYNEAYNAIVTPKYDGSTLTVNGLNSEFTLRRHQADAVARILNSGGNTLLAHRVGAGKTMEMAAAAMKLKQLGVIKKPMFVVPNNVVAQWGKEFKDYFPAANILVVGDTDMSPEERMTTINKIKNNDYDAVILAYTKFERIPMTKEWRERFYADQVDDILFAINAEKEAGGGKGFSVKQLEKKRAQLEKKIKSLADKEKDVDGAMFEDLGVDALFVDEAHNFKNLEYTTRMSNVSGLGSADGSQRAFDLYTKIRYLQQLNGGRGIVFATATPVMNSMTEMYIMQRYLQPDTLKELGIDNFDAWAKMFGEVVNALEIAPSGSGYRVKQTFSRFKNIKALQQLFRSFTDVIIDIPDLVIPKMKGGKVQIVECEPSPFQKQYMEELAKRAENVKNADPREDNMLKITSDGRKVSYSQRMIDPTLPYEENGKIYKLTENVVRVYKESKKNKGTQMIFCDMATPKGKDKKKAKEDETDEFDSLDQESAQLYDDIKARLIKLGIPAKEIAFIHDAKNDKQKAALADKMNKGTIRVLIGSTGKMGVGLNAQKKAIAIHHLDAPWRPGDIEQRDGRVFRQKNENPEAYKFVYVTKGSFDSRLWDILERKQKFINQVMFGDDVGNEIEDTGQVTLSAAEVKAVASDNPMIMEEVKLNKEIEKLESLQKSHYSSISYAKLRIQEDQRKIAQNKQIIEILQSDIKTRKDTYSTDKKFTITIDGSKFTSKADAGASLVSTIMEKAKNGEKVKIGEFAGFDLLAAKSPVETADGLSWEYAGYLSGAHDHPFRIYPQNTSYGISHLISVVESLDAKLKGAEERLAEAEKDLGDQRKIAAQPFEKAEELQQKRNRHQEIMNILNPPTEQSSVSEEQFQTRTSPLTDREVLELAANEINVETLSPGEKDALRIFNDRLGKLQDLEMQRSDLGSRYRELQFGKNGVKVDRAEASKVLDKMNEADRQIQKAGTDLLSLEDKQVLKRVLKQARNVVEAKEKEHGKAILDRYRDRRKNAADIKKYRTRIQTDVADMTKWVMNPGNKNVLKHIPDALKNTVLPFLSSIDLSSKRLLRGGEATKADKVFMDRLRAMQEALQANIKAEGLYSGYADLPEGFMEELAKRVSTIQKLVDTNKSGTFVLNQMTSKELKDLAGVVKTVKQLVVNFDRFHENAMFQHVHEAGDSTIGDLEQYKAYSSKGKGQQAVNQFLFWQQIRPAYAFERFGKGGIAVYDGLRRGQSKLAFNTKTITDFSEKAYTSEEVKGWEKEVRTIDLNGDKVRIPVANIMALYELKQRPHALAHIIGNGVRIATFSAKKEVISDIGHKLTKEDVEKITSTLTVRQKKVADNLQQFMQNQGGKWMNEVSVRRFGERVATEDHYFPIHSDGRHLQADAAESPSNASLYALLNMSFTKELTEKANNRIIVYSIFDVFANHMASMAQYNAMALPVLDALKWFNYKSYDYVDTVDENGKPKVEKVFKNSVRDELNRVYGTPTEDRPGSGKRGYAEAFITNILKGFNGTEAQGTPMDTAGLRGLHHYNRAQVAYNVRSVIQQPLAITRAAMILPTSSIIRGMKLNPSEVKANIEEMNAKNGIALWKSLGFYDVNISRGVTSIIKHDEDVVQKIIDTGLMGAEMADTLTWAAMWAACKEEVQRKGTSPSSKDFFDKVNALFDDVIYKTQVVDSILTKNEFMRDKGFFARAVGSFMSEPTTTASMLLNAFEKYQMDVQKGMSKSAAWRNNSKNIARTAAVYAVGALILAAVQAVADGWRDDDDYETFPEKWLEAFWGNLLDELSPFNKLPIVSDFYEAGKELLATFTGLDVYGNPPSSVIMQWYGYLSKFSKIMADKLSGENTNYTWYGAVYSLLQAASGAFGLPFATATREITSAWNNIAGAISPKLKLKTYKTSTESSVKYAYLDGYLTEDEAVKELMKNGKFRSEEKARNFIQSAGIRAENNPDIEKAAKAHIDGNVTEYTRLFNKIKKESKYSSDVIESAIKAKENELTKDLPEDPDAPHWESPDKITGAEELYAAILSGDQADQKLATDNLYDFYIADGYRPDQANAQIASGVASQVKADYLIGKISRRKAEDILEDYGKADQLPAWDFEIKHGWSWGKRENAFRLGRIKEADLKQSYMAIEGKTEEEADKYIRELKIENKYGVDYDNIDEAYAQGHISHKELLEIFVEEGMSQEEAMSELKKATALKDTGIAYDQIDDAYKAGKISATKARDMLIKYGGKPQKKAEEAVFVMAFEKKHPGCDGISFSTAQSYMEYGQKTGLSAAKYYAYVKEENRFHADYKPNGEAIRNSKKVKVVRYIASLPISSAQKDAVYLGMGYSPKGLRDLPW